jgi:hypothetical protein
LKTRKEENEGRKRTETKINRAGRIEGRTKKVRRGRKLRMEERKNEIGKKGKIMEKQIQKK